jgi:hypothetical protein
MIPPAARLTKGRPMIQPPDARSVCSVASDSSAR